MMPLLTGIHNIERSTFLQEALFHSLFSKSPPLFRTTLESRSAQTAQSCKTRLCSGNSMSRRKLPSKVCILARREMHPSPACRAQEQESEHQCRHCERRERAHHGRPEDYRRSDGHSEPQLVLLVAAVHVSRASASAATRLVDGVKP